mmetsp:Transcript_21233/g.40073  ORF Transcript_21233/g.40073 Transcript_21233/m.40073 type:complete len:136 (-) Transcript_21233:3136-3543(-)
MRTGLFLSLRSCIYRPHAAPAFLSSHSALVYSRRFSSPRQRNQVLFAPSPSLNYVRPLSSSSKVASSFEAPEPPKSQGQPVFPDINFQPSSPEDESIAAIKRNADQEAVFVVNGSNRGIGLQFVHSLLERTKVCE